MTEALDFYAVPNGMFLEEEVFGIWQDSTRAGHHFIVKGPTDDVRLSAQRCKHDVHSLAGCTIAWAMLDHVTNTGDTEGRG